MTVQKDPTPSNTTVAEHRYHELKTWPPYLDAVLTGKKTFEIRKADRPYAVGDVLRLREWSPVSESYSGRDCFVSVTFILPGGAFGLQDGYVCMSISR